MLDSFEILTTSGVVLWQKSYAPVGSSVINSLIRDVFIEEKVTPVNDASAASNPPYKTDKYTLKWTTVKDLGLIFVAVYQSLLHLSWIDKLLDNVKTIFTSLYRDQFRKPHTSLIECPFDDYFDRQIQALEKSAGPITSQNANGQSSGGMSTPATDLTPPSSAGGDLDEDDEPPPLPGLNSRVADPSRLAALDAESNTTSADATPIATPDSSRPVTPSSHLVTGKSGPAGKASRRARKQAATSAPQSRSASKPNVSSKGGKQMRRWDGNGADDGDDQVLDYSTTPAPVTDTTPTGDVPQEAIAQESWARKTGQGEVVLKDLDDEMANILSSQPSTTPNTNANSGITSSAFGAVTSLFRTVVGGKKLTVSDLQKPLAAMQNHLITKNVERTAASRLCSSVQTDLLDTRTSSFQSPDAAIATSMERALTKIMTPTSSLDLLRSIAARTASAPASNGTKRPYVISIVGVNGVGKSTTLAKLAFLLLHNNHRVLVCGADTFRSGAVEQLRVHVRALQSLIRNSATADSPLGAIDLYERGYGKDPAHIARDAVAHASQKDSAFDVVLIDTAGRRHNDSRLMSSLEGFARLAVPDKIFMVGEALVGSDAVEQARDFNKAFGPQRGLDGFIVSKCDTVGEMVGTIVSMVHATGVPVVAVGVGQHYGDLRTLNVGWACRLLMS